MWEDGSARRGGTKRFQRVRLTLQGAFGAVLIMDLQRQGEWFSATGHAVGLPDNAVCAPARLLLQLVLATKEPKCDSFLELPGLVRDGW
jgi:hypothetical protein